MHINILCSKNAHNITVEYLGENQLILISFDKQNPQ